MERKSILHSDFPAPELTQRFSYHNLHLILTSGDSPLSVIIGCEIWEGGLVWVRVLSQTSNNKNNIHAINTPNVKLLLCLKSDSQVFIASTELIDQSICASSALIGDSLISYLPGISWTLVSRLMKWISKRTLQRWKTAKQIHSVINMNSVQTYRWEHILGF